MQKMESTNTTTSNSFLNCRSRTFELRQNVTASPSSSYRRLRNSGMSGYLRPLSCPVTSEIETVRQDIKKSRSVPVFKAFEVSRRCSEESTNFLPEFKSRIGTTTHVPITNSSSAINNLQDVSDLDYISSHNICDGSKKYSDSNDNSNASSASAERELNMPAKKKAGSSRILSSVDLKGILNRTIGNLGSLKGCGGKPPVLLRSNEFENISDPGGDSFSNDKCDECEKSVDSPDNANEFFVSDGCLLNVSAMNYSSRSQISSIVDLQGILNKTNLRPSKDKDGIDAVLPESSAIENKRLKSLQNESNNFGIQSELITETEKLSIVSIGLDYPQNQDISLVSNEKNKYLNNTANTGEITNTTEQTLLFSDIVTVRKGFLERVYETIDDESDNENIIENKQESNIRIINIDEDQCANMIHKDKIHLLKSEEPDLLRKQRSRNDSRTSSDSYKIGSDGIEDAADERYFDEMWINFADRPLLPLKPYQKQKSLSCTNLVQTIKGLSKRNSTDNNRFQTSETTGKILSQTKENSSSEDDVSKDCKMLVPQLEDPKPWNKDEIFKSLTIKNYIWYHLVDAREASKRLLLMDQDGVFLIRPASRPTKSVLHTLCVTYNRCAYNMYIRNFSNGLIALGKRKKNEMTFSSMLEMIQFHQVVPISLHLTHSDKEAHVYLLITPPK